MIDRSSQSLARTVTYMKSGDGARMQGPLKKAASRLPPLTHQVVSAVLLELNVASHCAEGEGDSPTAELAQRLNGLVVSNDSDYFIFNSQCRGYVPLHSIGYGATNEPRLERVDPAEPPRMQLLVYRHQDIAASLKLPPSHLPVLAALIGNDLVDFSSELCIPNPKKRRFPGRVDPQDIDRIARTLSQFSTLPASTLAQIQDVVFSVLPHLLTRPSKEPHIITKLAASAYSYRLLPLTTPAPAFPLNPRNNDTPSQATSRAIYHSAYKASRLSSFIVHVLKHRTVCLQGPLEIPQYQTPVIYLGRPIRQMIYSILEYVVGIDSPTQSIIEYCRRGETMNPTSVPILPFTSYLPRDFPAHDNLLFVPDSVRFSLYLYLLNLPPDLRPSSLFPIIASLTHIVLNCPSSRQWSRHYLLSAVLTASIVVHDPEQLSNNNNLPKPRDPPNKEHLHASSELLTSLVWINTLGSSLGLIGSEWKGTNWKCYDGKCFHGLLGLETPTAGKKGGKRRRNDLDRLGQVLERQSLIVKEEVAGIMRYLDELVQLNYPAEPI